MVDVSHLSDAAFDQVRELMAGRPFIASHSDCRSLSPASRNLTDAQIRVLAGNGGVMGINLAPDFLDPNYLAAWEAIMAPVRNADAATRYQHRMAAGPQLDAIPRPSLDWVARHVQHAIAVGGEDCIGLGGDLDGISFLPAQVTGVESYPLIVDALRASGSASARSRKCAGGTWRASFRRCYLDRHDDDDRRRYDRSGAGCGALSRHSRCSSAGCRLPRRLTARVR